MELLRNSKNCRAVNILNMVYYCGELPARALWVYGSSADYMPRIAKKLDEMGYLRVEKMFKRRTFRLGKEKADPELLFMSAEEHYQSIQKELKISDKSRRYRNSIRAETCAFIKQSGYKLFPDEKPMLQYHRLRDDTRAFYTTKEVKSLIGADEAATYATRAIGVLVAPSAFHMVYYISQKSIRVSEITERVSVDEFTRTMNKHHDYYNLTGSFIYFKDALILTFSYATVLKSLLSGRRWKKQDDSEYYFSLDETYDDYRLLPYTKEGTKLLWMYTTPGTDEWLKTIVLDEDHILKREIDFPCDSITEEGYWIVFFNGKLKRLKRFLNRAFLDKEGTYHIICLDFQEKGLLEYIPANVVLHKYLTSEVIKLFDSWKGVVRK